MAYTPYPGNPYAYGFGGEHLFFGPDYGLAIFSPPPPPPPAASTTTPGQTALGHAPSDNGGGAGPGASGSGQFGLSPGRQDSLTAAGVGLSALGLPGGLLGIANMGLGAITGMQQRDAIGQVTGVAPGVDAIGAGLAGATGIGGFSDYSGGLGGYGDAGVGGIGGLRSALDPGIGAIGRSLAVGWANNYAATGNIGGKSGISTGGKGVKGTSGGVQGGSKSNDSGSRGMTSGGGGNKGSNGGLGGGGTPGGGGPGHSGGNW